MVFVFYVIFWNIVIYSKLNSEYAISTVLPDLFTSCAVLLCL
jgi:hypothetical protein